MVSRMALKYRVKAREEIPAELQRLYVERDGELVLDVEGAVEKTRADEVRASNASLKRERDALNARLTAIQIDQGVTAAASKKGLRASAIPDITARARGVFKLVDGAPVAYEADGETVRMGKDGGKPLSLDEWVDAQVGEAPHLFAPNLGGGHSPSEAGGRGGRGGKNPFKRESWNLTEQMRLMKTDPALAGRLKASA
jgi:hypothetical protein